MKQFRVTKTYVVWAETEADAVVQTPGITVEMTAVSLVDWDVAQCANNERSQARALRSSSRKRGVR